MGDIIKSIYGRIRGGGRFFTDEAEEEVARQVIWKDSWIQVWKKMRQGESSGERGPQRLGVVNKDSLYGTTGKGDSPPLTLLVLYPVSGHCRLHRGQRLSGVDFNQVSGELQTSNINVPQFLKELEILW